MRNLLISVLSVIFVGFALTIAGCGGDEDSNNNNSDATDVIQDTNIQDSSPETVLPQCEDNDDDGFGTGSDCVTQDCDDTNPAVNPNAIESCDGVDNDCDNQVDEDLVAPGCELTQGVCAGATAECEGTLGFGSCEYGSDFVSVEGPDHCDHLDNDCDGQVDEECACQNGETMLCGSDDGECHSGLQVCLNGQWGPCENEVGPTDEVCDGRDNDCDGEMDEELVPPDCSLQVGVCTGAKKACSGGIHGWVVCGGSEYGDTWVMDEDPLQDSGICDGADNDCDGQVDENCTCQDGQEQTCGSNIGACEEGV